MLRASRRGIAAVQVLAIVFEPGQTHTGNARSSLFSNTAALVGSKSRIANLDTNVLQSSAVPKIVSGLGMLGFQHSTAILDPTNLHACHYYRIIRVVPGRSESLTSPSSKTRRIRASSRGFRILRYSPSLSMAVLRLRHVGGVTNIVDLSWYRCTHVRRRFRRGILGCCGLVTLTHGM